MNQPGGWRQQMRAEHHGRSWQKDNQGTITWWDGQQWVWWDSNAPGPQPPPHFFASTQPVYHQPRQRKRRKWPLILGGILLLVVVGALASPDEEPTNEPTGEEQTQDDTESDPQSDPKPRFKERVLNTSVVNPATLNVVMEIRNTGDAPGSPDCTVDASDPSGTYSGFDIFEIGEIKPGKVDRGNGNITIENEGAVFVTEVNIECSD